MWFEFVITALAALVLLYLPGFLLCRALGFARLPAFVAAPIVMVGLVAALSVLYVRLGVSCNFVSITLPILLVCLVVCLVARPWRHNRVYETRRVRGAHGARGAQGAHGAQGASSDVPYGWPLLGLYVLVGLITTFVLYVGNLDTAATPFCRLDNLTHLNAIQAFLDSGMWSSLSESPYLSALPNQAPYDRLHPGFYPSAFYDLVALACSATGAGVTVGVNALVTLLCGVVFPAGMFLFMATLFPRDRFVVGMGAFATMAFAAFPWGFLTHGPLYANILGNSLMMPTAAAVILWAEGRLGFAYRLPVLLVFGPIAFAALALAHPSTLFALLVFVMAYAGHVAVRFIGSLERLSPGLKRVAQVAAIVIIAVAASLAWITLVNLPFLENLVGYWGGNDKTLARSLVHLLSGYLAVFGSQLVVAAVLAVGVLYCVYRRWWWLLVPLAYFGAAFVVARMPDSEIQRILAGFWYNKPFRVAGCYVLFAIPVLSVGLAWFARLLSRRPANVLSKRSAVSLATTESAPIRSASGVATAVVLAVFLVGNCVPFAFLVPGNDWKVDSGFKDGLGMVYPEMRYYYSADREQVLSAEEITFANRAVQITGNDLVINQPADGSLWLFGVNHLNTYYRYLRVGNLSERADVIRLCLDEYTTNKDVQEAITYTDARYVLQLDQGVAYEDGVWLVQYHADDVARWTGIDAIRDDTPGFEVVLSEGDMRLYRIVG